MAQLTVAVRWAWRGAVLVFLAAALILGAIVGSGRAAAQPPPTLAVMVDVDPEEQTWITTELIATVNEMMRLDPVPGPVQVVVKWRYELYGSYAGTAGNQIWFPPEYAVDTSRFVREVQTDVMNGFHPAGCSSARMVAVHEYAHVIDNYNDHRARTALMAEFGPGYDLHGLLPKYSFTNPLGVPGGLEPGEALATAFASVVCGTANDVENRIAEILLSS